jgi:aromatic-L-amino-acid decarboxylase
MHVDSAYAGVSAMLPEMAPHFKGLEVADSFDTNPHKWLLTNFDCSTLFVRDATHLKLALTLNPTFLVNKTNEYDYKVRINRFGMNLLTLEACRGVVCQAGLA